MSAAESIVDSAVSLAERRWGVFPCRPGDKRPAVDAWEQRAIADPDRVARYWPSPRHNIGVAPGPSGLVVLDLDMPKPDTVLPEEWRIPGVNEGADVLAVLVERQGSGWPHTFTTRTPTGGMHLYFRAIEGREIRNSAGKIGPLIDVRGAGGYVVGPGSVTSAGTYEVLIDTDPIPLPGWLADLADPPKPDRPISPLPRTTPPGVPRDRLRGLLDTVISAPAKQGNQVLHWAACRAAEMVAAGEIDEHTAEEGLYLAAVERGRPPTEARNTIASGMRRGAA